MQYWNKALALDNESHTAKLKSELDREKRDLIWAEPLTHLHEIGAFLKNLYPDNSQILGYYGFEVVEEKKPEKERNLSISFEATKIGLRTRIGSKLLNNGTTDLNIFKGKNILSIPILLKAKTEMNVAKGYSIFSIKNLSSTNSGLFTYTPL